MLDTKQKANRINKKQDYQGKIYLDHAATTSPFPEAVDAMVSYLESPAGNPTGAHLTAQKSRRALDDARQKLADIFGGFHPHNESRGDANNRSDDTIKNIVDRNTIDGNILSGDVIFCSGGTESDNLAIFGTVGGLSAQIFCSAIEHPAVMRPTKKLGGELLPVDENGVLDLTALEEKLSEETRFVSVMAVNNETGVIQPLPKIARLVRKHAPNAVLHTDAAQAVLWLDLAKHAIAFDLISLSAHKFGGVSGTGALLVRNGIKVTPQVFGGKQERDRRSGTPNVAGAIAMAKAAEIATEQREKTIERVGRLRDKFVSGLVEKISDIYITAEEASKVAGAAHICIEGIVGEELLFLLTTQYGIEASAGSSCASGAGEDSSVLSAMGFSAKKITGAIRFFLGYTTTEQEIEMAIEKIPLAVAELRSNK